MPSRNLMLELEKSAYKRFCQDLYSLSTRIYYTKSENLRIFGNIIPYGK